MPATPPGFYGPQGPVKKEEVNPQFDIAQPVRGLPEPAATDAAALLSIATDTPFDVERYRRAYMEKGLVTEWRGLEDMWRTTHPGASRARIEKMIEGKALRRGINFKPVTEEEVTGAIMNYAATKDDSLMHEVASRLSSEPMHPNADVNEQQIREVVSTSLEEYLVADRDATRNLKHAVDKAYLGMDTDLATLYQGLIAQVFLPTDIPISSSLRSKLETGKADMFELQNFSTAENMQALRESIAKASPEEKTKMAERLTEWAKENTTIVSDWQLAGLLGQLDNGRLLETGNPDDKLSYGLSILSDVADYFYGARILKLASMAGRATTAALPRTLRLANIVNRRRSSSILRGLVTGAENNDTLKKWGMTTEEVHNTQLPKPHLGTVVNLPGEVAADAARVSALREEISALDAATRSTLFDQNEVLSATERVSRELEQAWGPKLRVNLSTIGFTPDRAGVEFGLVLGRDDMHGFASARVAARFAKRIDDSGKNVSIVRVRPDQTLEEAYPGRVVLDPEGMSPEYGEFYVKLKHRYDMHPMDKMLFDDDAVLAPTWLGSAMKWVLPQTAIFKPSVANKYINNFMTEAALQDALGSIVRPMFKELTGAQRAKVGELWSWTEEFGRTFNRTPTWDEIRGHHLDISDAEILGWWRMKQFYDTAYALNNNRMWRDWNARGFKTLYKDGTRIHGKPLSVPEARSNSDSGFVTVYDPERNRAVAIRTRDLERVYERGMSILQIETPITTTARNYHTLVLSRPHLGWNLKDLDQNVLKYIPGYYPRIYEDAYYIKRITRGARVNGKMQDYEDTVAVASTEKEAQDFIARMQATRGDDSITYVQSSDARLRTRDATASDLDRMRIEGRLFFDERNAHQLYNVNGNPADIVDPINAINRTARMLSRQMSTEDLTRGMKQAWKNTYGAGIKGLNVDTDTSVVVGDKLNEMIKTSPKTDRARLVQARALWDHIRLIEGSSGEGATWFRGKSIQVAEFLHNLRGVGRNKVTSGLLRNAHKVAPVEWMKNLAFFDFLVTRPARQLFLQGSQHMFLAPLAPTYLGKWQLDTFSALQGLKRAGLVKSGLKDVSEAQSARNAKLMGLDRNDYDLLIEKLRESGVVQTVNVHSYAGDLPRKIETTRYSAAGRFAEGAVGALTARPVRRALEKYGFELGEQVNVVASYMMALRLHRDANGIAKLTDITSEGWDEIRAQASNYAMAMHRANSASYQYGLLSLPLQFLQFTHKVALTYMRAVPGLDKLGNKAFTPSMARKILLGQLIMFGGASFGIRPEVEKWLANENLSDVPDTVKDLVAGGSIDWMLNTMIQKSSGDPDLRWAFGDWLAPGGNMIHLVREMVQTIAEQPSIVVALGPSYVTSSRFVEGIQMAREIWSHEMFEESEPTDRALFATEALASGLMSGYNDFMRARLAMKMGFWASQSGHQTEIEAKFTQALVKAGLGLNPQQLLDSNALRRDVSKELKDLDEVAQVSYDRMYRIVGLFGDTSDRQRFLNDVRSEQALLQILEPHEIQYVWQKWQSIERDNPQRKPLSEIIGQAIGNGYQGEELRDRIRSTHALDHDPETRAKLIELLDRASQDVDWTNEKIKESTEREIDSIKRQTEK